ncbi:HAD family hydrolase [Virgisporangium ochraceum]|uniref:HAD family hydrolase n=1 Tax=Virgisporangium ochraceum TaxID=65505 RepID=UPI0019443227|nr:haloacid dehalogenase-like hydrolase [Virgisporangium ochraceum]
MSYRGLIVWDVDGTLIPADLRWLRRAIARTYEIAESDVVFPSGRVHGYTDESIVIDAAVLSGISPYQAEKNVGQFRETLALIMDEGRLELAREQPAYPGARDTIRALDQEGFVQTVLTGNLAYAATVKLDTVGLNQHLDLSIGGFGSDARDRFELTDVVSRRFMGRQGEQLDPGRAVVIGDAPNDVACARHAGFRAIVVAHRTSREELAASMPDSILDALDPDRVVAEVIRLIG